jgi:hypothetical protein
MSIEAMKQGLEALKSMKETLAEHDEPTTFNEDEAIKALEEALAKQEQRNVTKDEHDVLMKALSKSVKVVDAGFLAKQEQRNVSEQLGEPVAWRFESGKAVWFERTDPEASSALPNDVTAIPLYTTPQPKREPLTDEQIREFYNDNNNFELTGPYVIAFARAIEAAHGIGVRHEIQNE